MDLQQSTEGIDGRRVREERCPTGSRLTIAADTAILMWKYVEGVRLVRLISTILAKRDISKLRHGRE